MRQTQTLYDTLVGTAALPCMEPELSIELKAQAHGQITMIVEITPDHLAQQHRFEFDIDQSHLPQLLAQGQKVLAQFPLKDADADGREI